MAMRLWRPHADDAVDAVVARKDTPPQEPQVVLDLSKSATNFDYPQRHYSVSPVEPSLPASHSYFPGYLYVPIKNSVSSPDSITSNNSATFSSINTGSSSPASLVEYDRNSLSDDEEYKSFEKDALKAMEDKNGGYLLGNNPRMRRAVQTNKPSKPGDSYRKQREKNNIAAKLSRDRRKLREIRLALQVTFLEKQMAYLRARIAAGICSRCQKCASEL